MVSGDGTRSVSARVVQQVYAQLAALADPNGVARTTQPAIAGRVGLSRDTVNRAVRALKREGLVAVVTLGPANPAGQRNLGYRVRR